MSEKSGAVAETREPGSSRIKNGIQVHLKSEGGREVKPGGREDEGVRESRVRHSLASLSF